MAVYSVPCGRPLLTTAIYRFHPDFKGQVTEWWGDPDVDHAMATLEGGDVMPVGGGVVLIGMGERSTPQAVLQVAQALFAREAAERVIACRFQEPLGDAPGHGFHHVRPRSGQRVPERR